MNNYVLGLTTQKLRIAMITLCLGFAALILTPACGAASAAYTWDGGGADDAWTLGANWNTDVAPPNDASAEIRFSGVYRRSPVVNGTKPWSIRKLLFTSQAGQFILSGNPLFIADAIGSQDQGSPIQTISNNITFTSPAPSLQPGFAKTLVFCGKMVSAIPVVVRSSGASKIQVANGGSVDVGVLEISAANAHYGHVTLQLDHSMALSNTVTLKLTPKADGTKLARVNLNFNSGQAQVVAGLVLNGMAQADGIYNSVTHPNYFSGAGNLLVGRSGNVTQSLTKWSEWGPAWGRAGLSVARYNAEGFMAPQAGDIDNNSGGLGRGMIEWRDIVSGADGFLNFLDPYLFPRVAESRLMDGHEWAGMVEHLHTYVKASDTGVTSAMLNVQSFPNRPELWLNGESVAAGQTIVLKPGWNRLMVGSRSPRTPDGQSWAAWSFAATLTSSTANIQLRTTDPERRVLVTDDNRPFRYLSTLARTDGDSPVYTLGTSTSTDVTVRYNLQVAIGTYSNYQAPSVRRKLFGGYPWVYSFDPARIATYGPNPDQPWTTVPAGSWASYAPSKVKLLVRDDRGRTVLDQTYPLSYGPHIADYIAATRQISLRALTVGHYTILSKLLDETGAVLARDNDHSFAVVVGPVDRLKDEKPRSLGVVGHWLLGSSAIDTSGLRYPARLRWLNRVGITRQQKLWEGWDFWGSIRFDAYGNVRLGQAPRVDEVLALAKALNIDITGDLVEGYFQSALNNLILPGNGQTMPAYGSVAWSNLFYSYGFELATKYKGQIKTWGGINEIDGRLANNGYAAEMYVEAARQIVAGMKAADPSGRYISSSLIKTSSAQTLFNRGFLGVPDVVDVHSHPWRAPEPWESSLTPYSGGEGRTMLINNAYTGPLIYGEMSAPRGHNPRGARGQAEDMVKQLTWAINWRDVPGTPVTGINYLVAYDAPDYWSYNFGFNNQYGDPLPVVNAANVASRLLDGRNRLPALTRLPAGVSHIRVTNPDSQYPETLVVWKSSGPTTATFTVTGNSVKIVDIMGRQQTYAITGGQLTLPIDTTPQYVLGKFQ
jgi:hypothetical protein